LIDLGCRYGQGFLYARGQSAEYWLRPENHLP
jgi:EAL domain-containing protein (putative c-di-GMP-specific phosphodiesterase class I)